VSNLALRDLLTSSFASVITAATPKSLFRLGTLLYDVQAWDEAERVFARVSELLPDSSSPHHMRAMSLTNSAKYPEALEEYRAAIKVNASSAQSYNNMGVLLAKLGHVSEALLAYQDAIAADPEYPDSLQNIKHLHRF
jgi:tetratricopeptide (TPR) repeat protein